MNCPYCNQKMESGHLKTEGGPGLIYMPMNQSYGLFPTKKKIEKKGGIALDGPYKTRFNFTSITSYACKSCKKIIIDYSE